MKKMKIRINVENYETTLKVLSELGYDISGVTLNYPIHSVGKSSLDGGIPFGIGVINNMDNYYRYGVSVPFGGDIFINNIDRYVVRFSREDFKNSEIPEYKLIKKVYTTNDKQLIYEFVNVKEKKKWKFSISGNNLVVIDYNNHSRIVGYAICLETQKAYKGLKVVMEDNNYDTSSLMFDEYGALKITTSERFINI